LGPFGRTARKTASRKQRRQLDLVEVAALDLLEALTQLAADPLGGRLRQLPQPRLLAERLDVAHRQPAHERADHHRPQRLAAQDLRAAREQPRDERLGGLPELRDLDLELPLERLQLARAKAVAKPALIRRPALITRPAQPGVELVLHGALDDQPGPEPGELRQRLARVLADPHGKQLVDLLLDLRRRRYGTSHGVGLLQLSLVGLEGTYAVALTAPGHLQHLGDATHRTVTRLLVSAAKRYRQLPRRGQAAKGQTPGERHARGQPSLASVALFISSTTPGAMSRMPPAEAAA
jgi:hypothetical protein